MPIHFRGKPILAEKFQFPGDSGHRGHNGQWEFELLPKNFQMPYVGWWMSEKYDGVRSMWNGEQFISRGGKVYNAPDWFKKQMPRSTGLDGEFFAGHEGFACVSGTVRRKQPVEADWKHVKFMAFDILHNDCLKRPYSVRYSWLKKIVAESRRRGGRQLELIEQIPITSMKQAYDYYKKILRRGGEGLVLRDPHATYEQKRSRTLLKWKPIPEQEAKVVGFTEGKGRFKGMLGSFKVQMVDDRTKKLIPGHTFHLAGKISTNFRSQYRFDKHGKLMSGPPKSKQFPRLGDVVTYQYMTLTSKGLPRQPVFLRLRHT